MKGIYSVHPRGGHKGASHGLDPNDRLPNCEHPFYSTSKSLSELLPLHQSKSLSHIFSRENKKKKKKRFILNFPLTESHGSLKCTSIYSKGSGCSSCQVNYLAYFSANVLLLWECLTGRRLWLRKVKYYKIIHRLG